MDLRPLVYRYFTNFPLNLPFLQRNVLPYLYAIISPNKLSLRERQDSRLQRERKSLVQELGHAYAPTGGASQYQLGQGERP